MKPLVPRPIDWIDAAPVAIRGEGVSAASPDAVFAVLADHERWPEWFPNVRKVIVTGPAEGVGAQRRVHVPGLVVEEEFIVWDPGVRWSFTGTEARPGIFRSIVEDCRLTPTVDGGTGISYTMYIDPVPALALPTRALKGMVRSSIRRAMRNLGERAAAS